MKDPEKKETTIHIHREGKPDLEFSEFAILRLLRDIKRAKLTDTPDDEKPTP